MSMNGHFDRKFHLKDVLAEKELAGVKRAFSLALSCDVDIAEPEMPRKPGHRYAETLWELEPIARIESKDASLEQLEGCSEILLLLLKETIRYRTASELHMETVRADYKSLREKHNELQNSEQRYKKLSNELEEKVAAQVKEIEGAQRKIFQSEKLASVGQLAAGIAHELNTPLAYIQNNLTAAQDYLKDLESFFTAFSNGSNCDGAKKSWKENGIDDIRKDFPVLVGSCLDGVTRLVSIVSDLKIFSNINLPQQALDNINARLETVLKMLKPQISPDIEIVKNFSDIPDIECYPAYLGQAFYNLIQNGIHAIEGKGRISIRTFKSSDQICVSIADTGTGIPEHEIHRIFDPFFTTKEVGKGTGLGLSVVHDVIKAHHGRIEVKSAPGRGTVFAVFLPDEKIQESQSPGDRQEIPGCPAHLPDS
jgi:two-component system NtrC family sensor kinase